MLRPPQLLLIAALFFFGSCASRPSGPPAIGEVFAGPSSLPIRQDLTLRSPVVATVKHGERLDVLQTRRRFVQVRTSQGAVGWTDNRQLLTPGQMQEIRNFAEATSSLPSQGSATVFEQLNVHTEPSRTSPSFVQIPETGSVQVIGHKLAPRTAAVAPAPPRLPKKPARTLRKSREKESRRVPPPPMPPAPEPPSNWLDLSRPRDERDETGPARAGESADSPPAQQSATKPVAMEDWSLIRTKDNKVGWVLSRMLNMSIPDDVAQYAEGHRITSYFALSDIPDEGQTRHAWLWTTSSHAGEPFEYDGLRVFTWNTRRHRYETVYRERVLRGFYPVEAHKASGDKNAVAKFSVVVETGGQLIRKTYAFNGYRVSLLSKEPYSPREIQIANASSAAASSADKQSRREPWYTALGSKVRSWFHR